MCQRIVFHMHVPLSPSSRESLNRHSQKGVEFQGQLVQIKTHIAPEKIGCHRNYVPDDKESKRERDIEREREREREGEQEYWD